MATRAEGGGNVQLLCNGCKVLGMQVSKFWRCSVQHCACSDSTVSCTLIWVEDGPQGKCS